MKILPFNSLKLQINKPKQEIVKILRENFNDLHEYELETDSSFLEIKRMKKKGMTTYNSYLNIRINFKEESDKNTLIKTYYYFRLKFWLLYLFFNLPIIFIIVISENQNKYYLLIWSFLLYIIFINNDGLTEEKNKIVQLFK